MKKTLSDYFAKYIVLSAVALLIALFLLAGYGLLFQPQLFSLLVRGVGACVCIVAAVYLMIYGISMLLE